jgi:protein-tyrosine phosphatase
MDDGGLRAILVVCTANQCRSPLVTVMLRERLAARDVDVTVQSAGTRAYDGSPATDRTRAAARRLGLDLSDHRSVPLAAAAVRDAGLVLGLERAHVREVVALEASAWPHAFTLKELVRRGVSVGPRPADEPVMQWLARIHQGRRPMDLLGASAADDVADPTDSWVSDHPSMAEDVDRLTADLVALLYPN